MKIFGWKAAAPEATRPILSRGGAISMLGEWPRSYEAQVRAAYLDNAIAQRSVRLIAEGIGGAPLVTASPEVAALVEALVGVAKRDRAFALPIVTRLLEAN